MEKKSKDQPGMLHMYSNWLHPKLEEHALNETWKRHGQKSLTIDQHEQLGQCDSELKEK